MQEAGVDSALRNPVRLVDLPAHVQLMLRAARFAATDQERTELAGFPMEHVDWPEFLAVTATHRLAPLVYAGLQTARPAGVPQTVCSELREALDYNSLRVMKTLIETKHLVTHFEKAGFRLIVLKGVPLSEHVYGSPLLRHCGDLDLLLTGNDLYPQVLMLQELGYAIDEPQMALTPARFRIYQRYWKGLTMRHRETGFVVDLHWRLFNSRHHPGNRLINAAGTMDATDRVLYIAAHGVSDSWVYLKGLADLAACLRAFTQEEFDACLKRAAALRLSRQFSSAVRLAGQWFGAPYTLPGMLPAGEAFHAALQKRVAARLLRDHFRPQRQREHALAALRFELRLTPGWQTIREVAGRYLWRPRIWSFVDLPDRLLWLHPMLGLFVPPRGRVSSESFDGRQRQVPAE